MKTEKEARGETAVSASRRRGLEQDVWSHRGPGSVGASPGFAQCWVGVQLSPCSMTLVSSGC